MQIESMYSAIKRATLFDIFIISFFVLPIAAAQWIKVLEVLQWNLHMGLGGMVLFYIIAVAIMMIGAERAKRYERSRDLILGYLFAKNFEMMSFERIRERIDTTLTDEFLVNLINKYPTVFRRSALSGKKPGLARLDGSDQQENVDA